MTDKLIPTSSIAILKLAALGDMCMTLPLVASLRHGLPDSKLFWIIDRQMHRFLEGLPGVKFIVLDKPHNLRSYWQCYQTLKPYRFDVLLAPQACLRTNLLCHLVKARLKYGFARLHSRDGQRLFVHRTVPSVAEHLTPSFLRFAEVLNVHDKILHTPLPISEDDIAWAKQQLQKLPGRYLAVCPSASKQERNWPSDRYIAALNQLAKNYHFNVIFIGGPAPLEQEIATNICRHLNMPWLNLVGKTSLKQLAAILQNVDLLLSPDTGPLHVADCLGTAIVGLYAVAPPEKTGPYRTPSWVVNQYPEAVRRLLHKDPATVSWRQRVHHPEAMILISVEQVVASLNQALASLGFDKK